MGQVLFIVWRESVEALLVVGILYAWLKNGDADASRGIPYLWAGVAAGSVLHSNATRLERRALLIHILEPLTT